MPPALLLQPGCAVHEEPRGIDLHRHVRELVLDRLEVGDAMPERAPLGRILARDLVSGLGDPERLRRDADAPAVERSHRHPETTVLVVKQPVSTDPRALDDDVARHGGVEPELFLVTGHAHVFRVEDERAHAARPGDLGIGAREQDERPRVASVRDPLLRAGDRPAVSCRFRSRLERARV